VAPRIVAGRGAIRLILLAAAVVDPGQYRDRAVAIFEAISFLSRIQLSQLFAAGWFPRRGQF
jgi:hypothetical protein